MGWYLAGFLIIVAVLLLATRRRHADGESADRLPYVLSGRVFSPAERSFLDVLEESLGDEFRVFGKVRAADVLGIASCQTRAAWRQAAEQMSARHFDFLLCRKEDLTPVCAIELNEAPRQRGKRRRRDDFLHSACAAAGLPLVFFPAQQGYLPDEVRGAVAAALNGGETADNSPEVCFG